METPKTDRDLLYKGVKTMLIAIALMFTGPSLLFLILSNKDKDFYYILLTIAITICILAVFFAFKGIQTLMDSLFGKKK